MAGVKITLPKLLNKPHDLAEQSSLAVIGVNANEHGIITPRRELGLSVHTTPKAFPRALCIMDTLIKNLDSLGAKVRLTKIHGCFGTVANVCGEGIAFSILEGCTRVEREQTPAEENEWAMTPWAARKPVYQYSPSGQLVLRIDDQRGLGIRCRWADGKKQRVQNLLPGFIESMYLLSDQVVSRQRQWEENPQLEAEAERARVENERQRKEEEHRVNQLLSDVAAWQQSRLVRAYIRDTARRVEGAHGPTAGGERFQAWKDWASLQADRLDPLIVAPSTVPGP